MKPLASSFCLVGSTMCAARVTVAENVSRLNARSPEPATPLRAETGTVGERTVVYSGNLCMKTTWCSTEATVVHHAGGSNEDEGDTEYKTVVGEAASATLCVSTAVAPLLPSVAASCLSSVSEECAETMAASVEDVDVLPSVTSLPMHRMYSSSDLIATARDFSCLSAPKLIRQTCRDCVPGWVG